MIRDVTENEMEKCAGILADNLMWERYETVGAIREYKKEGIDEYLLVKRRP